MKPLLALAFLTLFGIQHSFAQNQTNIWYFGLWGALDFNSGAPVVLTNGNTDTNEGVASMCDSSGNLLFYTDGVNVWNKNNALMPNGTGLQGDVSTTQTIIVPNPGDSTLYYIFTLDDEGGADGFTYSIVNLTLDGGNGDVSTKNTLLRAAPMTEKVCAVYHCNNHDIWVMAHEQNSNAFLAYLVTDNGISAPIISNTGIPHTDVHGQMKFTSDGSKLASAVGFQDTVQVFDFDNKTGVVSNPVTLSFPSRVYGIEFSPDNSKLYITSYDPGGGTSDLYQADMNAANMQASLVSLVTDFNNIFYGLQLASDNKIYVSKNVTPFVCVINSPNLAGIASDFVDNVINIDPNGFGGTVKLGLPGFIQSYFHPAFPFEACDDLGTDFTSSDTVICIGECVDFSGVSGCNTDTWQWRFDGASTPSSSVENPTGICYPAAGTFEVELIASNGCVDDTMLKSITVAPAPTLDAGPDVTISSGASTQLNATGDAVAYQWTPAAGLSVTNIANPVATPLSTTTYYVTGADANGCEATDSVTVTIQQGPCSTLTLTFTISVTTDDLNTGAVRVTVTGGQAPYSYSLDNTTFQGSNVFTNLAPGTYQLYVTDDSGCPGQGTFTIERAGCCGGQ